MYLASFFALMFFSASGNWSEAPSPPPSSNSAAALFNTGDRILIEGPITFIENATDERFVVDSTDDSSWSYEINYGYMSQYLVSGGLLAANPREGIYSLGFTVSFGDWFFGTWTGQSVDDPGRDGTFANEHDWFAGWGHSFSEHFAFGASLSYYDLAAPKLFSGTRGDLVELELELTFPYEHFTPYVVLDKYFEIAGDDGDGFVIRAGLRGHWGSDEIWWDFDVSLGHAENFYGDRDYIWVEVGPGFKIGEYTSISLPRIQFLLDDSDDHIALGVSVTYEFN